MRKLWILIVLWNMLGLLSCKTTLSVAEFEAEILRLTNQQRAIYSLPALLPDEGLSNLARNHGLNMARYHYFDHQDKEGLQVSGRQKRYYPQLMVSSIGENLAYHQNSALIFSPNEVVEGWMNSPGHRKNILSPDYSHLGVGVVLVGDELYSVQNFAYPIVKISSKQLSHYKKDYSYRFQFEYMAVKDKSKFEAYLLLPDPNTKVFLNPTTYTLGVKALEIKWLSSSTFNIDLPFEYGKGKYGLAFGWGDGHFESEFKFLVK